VQLEKLEVCSSPAAGWLPAGCIANPGAEMQIVNERWLDLRPWHDKTRTQ
jgi:uncharacterized protein YbdZ (MbtH family)